MSRQSIQSDGRIVYRTKLMSEAHAESFALCLGFNGDFMNVDAVESETVKPESEKRWFVTFQPINSLRFDDMTKREQDKRKAKAETEGANYLFWFDMDGIRPFFWLFNPVSGEVYSVDRNGCSCPDHQFRCAAAGLRCKHREVYFSRIKTGVLEHELDLRFQALQAKDAAAAAGELVAAR